MTTPTHSKDCASEMVDRVARAINPYAFEALDAGRGDITLPGNIEHSRKQARAAIQAMKSPTEAMVYAGLDTGTDHGPGIPLIYSPETVWTAMIEAALK